MYIQHFYFSFLTNQISLRKLIAYYKQFFISSYRKTKFVFLFSQANKIGNSWQYQLRRILNILNKGYNFSLKFSLTLTQHRDGDRRRTIYIKERERLIQGKLGIACVILCI